MALADIKLDLTKKLLATEDKELLNHIKAVLDTQANTATWFEDLPDEIKLSVEKGLTEADSGHGISHTEAMKKYEKWLKK